MGSGLPAILPRDDVLAGQIGANEELIGPFFLGIIVNYFLWGIQVTQSYYYYRSYRTTDTTTLKCAVALLFLTDTIQSICVSEGVWRFMVDGWGNGSAATQRLSPGFNMITLMDALTASIVHALYAQKIWKLLDSPVNYVAAVIVLILSCSQLAGGIGCSALAFSLDVSLVTFFHLKTWACVWLVTASVTDIVITGFMTWKLSKSRTGFKKTDDIISKLIRLTVETGLAPAIGQTLDLVVFLVWPAKSYHVTLTILLPKVYSNSMMALLNSRKQRATTQVWDSRHDKQGDGIQIHTTQTVAVTNDFELVGILNSPGARSDNLDPTKSSSIRSLPYNKANSVKSLPSYNKDLGIAR